MPGFLVHVGAQVMCSHGGQAQPTAPNPRVTVSAQPTVTIAPPYAVAGCTLPPPIAANGPCVTATWLTGSTRVLANGQPLVVQSSSSICAPTGTPLMITPVDRNKCLLVADDARLGRSQAIKSYQQLLEWVLPPLVICPVGAH